MLDSIQESFKLDQERANSVYSPEMIAMIKAARTVKIENKTRERQRELRGEVTKRSIRLKKKGPPAHILSRMTPEQRRLDKVAREVSWGGYSGRIKREMRMRQRAKSLGPQLKLKMKMNKMQDERNEHQS